jgi:hypothetical protein
MLIYMEPAPRRDPDINIASVNSLRIFIKSRKSLRKLSSLRGSKIESKSFTHSYLVSLKGTLRRYSG